VLDRVITVRVDRVTRQTADVAGYEFVHARGGTLPGYRPGAHIDVHLPGGFVRQYSLARAAAGPACERYVIGVKREPHSRGGSAALHERVREGDLLAISTPRNTFALRPEAAHHLLLAGGIGLTPLLAMAQQLARDGTAFTLCAFARSRRHLPFAAELAALGPRVRLHFDDAAAPEKLSLPALLAERSDGTHLYLCGPSGFMQAARAAAGHWPDDAVHVEHFAPPAAADAGDGEPFTLRLARRGIDVAVEAGQSAVEALHDLGIDVPTSCEQGLCGTCVVDWHATDQGGEPEHRDHCLSASERRGKVALCCSRAKNGMLVVEL
jgi:vanillate O-demethylase ferredoxin subunit